jgi:hypothetical protein
MMKEGREEGALTHLMITPLAPFTRPSAVFRFFRSMTWIAWVRCVGIREVDRDVRDGRGG